MLPRLKTAPPSSAEIKAAVEAWELGEWDLIVMDVQMPVMDGLTAARLIRERELLTGRVRAPMIALTANVMSHQLATYRDAGMDGVVAKPIAVAEWGTAIRGDGHGLGDDPLYVSNMIAWMRNPSHDVVFETYFDYDGRGTNSVITGGHFPDSLAAFRAAFKPTNVGTGTGGMSSEWFALAGLVVAGGVALRWKRRLRGRRRAEPPARRIYGPTQGVAPTRVPEWAEQSR